jgi:zinc protease
MPMCRPALSLLLSLSLFFAPGLAQPTRAQSAAAPAAITSVEGITEYRLANGLQLLLAPDQSKPTTTVNLTYRVGSRHENYGETGMAHLLEHLIFKGTPTTKNVWSEFTRRGLRANGTTWVDRTNYFASFTANDDNLRWVLGWLADSMVNSFIAKEDLASEMTVVRNEMEMGENNPGRILFQRTLATMYDWHNYGKSTIGARADVENVDISRLQAFYRLHYQPDNATLIVAGRFDPALVMARVAETFGALPRPQRALQPTYTLDPVQDGERQVTVRRVGAAPMIFMAHHVPPGSHPDYAAVALLGQVLGDTPGGRLHKRLVETQLAASTFAFPLAMTEPGALFAGAQLAPGQDIDKARDAMAAVLDGIAKEPISAEELERARTQWINGWEQGFTDPEVIGIALSESIALGDWRLYFLQRDQVRKVTLADLQRVAGERLKPDNRTVAIYRPTAQPDRAPAPAKVDVAAMVKDYKGDANVAQAEAFDATPGNLDRRSQTSTLASGMKVLLLPKGTRGRAVQARLRLHYGDEKTLLGLQTVGSMAAGLLDKGGAGLTRQQIADRFDTLRAQVGFSADDQTLTVSIDTVREHLPATVELVGKLLREPGFPADALEEQRRQRLAGLAEQRREPEAMVANAIGRLGNPYPRGDLRHTPTFDEQEADLKAVTAAQLNAFARRFYAAARAEFAAVGDHEPAAVKRALEAAFGDWRMPAGGAQPYVRIKRPLVTVPAERLVLQAPDKQNATLLAALRLPLNDSHADYPAFMLANHIFGAGGSSRLWKRIRETEGLSYDVRSFVQWNNFEANSPWIGSAIFAPQNLPKVEAAWRDEIARSVKDGFTAAELAEAKSSLLNFRRLSRAQDAVVAGSAVVNLYLGRTFAYSQQIDDRLAAATLEQVNDAWRRYVVPDRVATAWGGDFAKNSP